MYIFFVEKKWSNSKHKINFSIMIWIPEKKKKKIK